MADGHPNYNENLIQSATNRARVYARVMTSSSTTRKTVLVAADTPFVRDRFKTALDAAGHRALVVKSVAQLLAHVRADFDELDLDRTGSADAARVDGVDARQAYPQARRGPPADPGLQRQRAAASTRCASWRRWASPATSTSTAPSSTSCRSIAPHLFPDTFTGASDPRVVMGIPVSYRDRQDDCGGAGAEPEPRRHGDSHATIRPCAAPWSR